MKNRSAQSEEPFRDRPVVDLDPPVSTLKPSKAGIDTREIDKFRQGASVRDMSDYRKSLIYLPGSANFPFIAGQKLSHILETTSYGQAKLWEDPSPFYDIPGRINPVIYLNSCCEGVLAYPVILDTPYFLDPAQMDGVIEPLDIRRTRINSAIGGPFTSHTIRASLHWAETVDRVAIPVSSRTHWGGKLAKKSELQPPGWSFFEDSANVISFGSVTFKLGTPGYYYPNVGKPNPFDDSVNLYSDKRDFGFIKIRDLGLGSYQSSNASQGWTFMPFVTGSGESGPQIQNGQIDSIAYIDLYRREIG